MNPSRPLAVVALTLFVSCISSAPPPVPRERWLQWSSPEEAGFDARLLEAERVHADKIESAAVMVVYRGQALAAWGDVARKLELHSVRKSLYAALYGIAVEKGLIDPDATLAELGIDDIQRLTDAEKLARIEDLLFARSGVYHPAAYAASDQDEERPQRGSHAPGTHWFYNNWDFNVAGALLERATQKPLGQLFDEWIARPIGMEDFEPSDVFEVLEPRTSNWPALTFRMSTRDLARFGLLWLEGGRWGDRQIISQSWIERASASRSQVGETGRGYAMMWWTYDAGSLSSERYPNANRFAMLQARGTGGQAMMIVPDAQLVFVHRGDTDHGRRVSGGEIWSMFDSILGARLRDPSVDAAFRPLDPVPLARQLPAFEWPPVVALDVSTAEALVGSYEFRPGLAASVYLHDRRLFAFMPGKGEAELFATSPSEFFIRVDPTVAIRFERDDAGRNQKVIIRMDGREMIGTRVEPRAN